MNEHNLPLNLKIERLKLDFRTMIINRCRAYDLPQSVVIPCIEAVIGRMVQEEYELLCQQVSFSSDDTEINKSEETENGNPE